LKNVLGFF